MLFTLGLFIVVGICIVGGAASGIWLYDRWADGLVPEEKKIVPWVIAGIVAFCVVVGTVIAAHSIVDRHGETLTVDPDGGLLSIEEGDA